LTEPSDADYEADELDFYLEYEEEDNEAADVEPQAPNGPPQLPPFGTEGDIPF